MNRDDHPASVISPAIYTRASDPGPLSSASTPPASSRRRRHGTPTPTKTFVLDTSVLLYDSDSIYKFSNHHVCIPIDVLSELDRFKIDNNERSSKAREASEKLNKIFSKGASVTSGVPTNGGGSIRVALYDPEEARKLASVQGFERIFHDLDKADHRILACTLWLSDQVSTPLILVSKDLNMQLKARAVGIDCEDYDLPPPPNSAPNTSNPILSSTATQSTTLPPPTEKPAQIATLTEIVPSNITEQSTDLQREFDKILSLGWSNSSKRGLQRLWDHIIPLGENKPVCLTRCAVFLGFIEEDASLLYRSSLAVDASQIRTTLLDEVRLATQRGLADDGDILSPGAAALLEEARTLASATENRTTTHVRHVIAAFLLNPEFRSNDSSSDSTLKKAGLDLDQMRKGFGSYIDNQHLSIEALYRGEWNRIKRILIALEHQIPSILNDKSQVGTIPHFSREAGPNELCLDIAAYASAIAETFQKAPTEGDFVFALFGSWGRGKTTLMKEVARILEEESKQPQKLQYQTIFFSAWKYPSRPEVWVHLYQQIARLACSGGIWQSPRIAFRLGLVARGWWPLMWGFILLTVSRIQIDIANWLFDAIGIIGIAILASFAWKSYHLGKDIYSSYFSVPRHMENLGLQAVIGEDLENLLSVWVRNGTSKDKTQADSFRNCDFTRWWPARILFISVVILISTSFFLVSLKAHHHAQHSQIWHANLTIVEWLLIALCAISLLLTFLLVKRPIQCDRTLLVVDDLDRCEPDQMLSVIESIRLFLEEGSVNSRMQVAMLMDRSILWQSLERRRERQGWLIQGDSIQTFSREEEEKLFVASLQLPELEEKQIGDLVCRIIDREIHIPSSAQKEGSPLVATSNSDENLAYLQEAAPSEASSNPNCIEPSSAKYSQISKEAITASENSQEANDRPKKVDDRNFRPHDKSPTQENEHWEENIYFADHEREILKGALTQISSLRLTPRSIRSFIIRYQLARLLLRHLNQPFSGAELIQALISHMYPLTNRSLEMYSPPVRHAVTAVAAYSPDI